MAGFAQQLAGRIAEIGPRALGKSEICWARSAAIDTLAVMLAGSATETAQLARRIEVPDGGEAIVFGASQGASPTSAAFLNGISAHALEYDDYSHDVRGHPSALLYSSLLATPTIGERSGLDVILAYIAGLKTQVFLARLMGQAHARRGWHVTSTIGTVAAAAASAKLLRLDPAQLATALSLATSLASGHRANFGAMAKALQLGHASRNGLAAALLAKEGMSAGSDSFEGSQGFFRAYADGIEAEVPGDDWAQAPMDFSRSGFRLHPGCGALLAAAQAAIALHVRGICPDEIAKVEIVADQEKFSQTDRPKISTLEAAQFSVQYATARGLFSGRLTIADFMVEAVAQPAIAALMRKIRLVPNQDAARPMGFGSIVRVTLQDGTVHASEELGIAGTGEIDMVESTSHRAKFRSCADPLLTPERADALWRSLAVLETVDRIGPVLDLARIPS